MLPLDAFVGLKDLIVAVTRLSSDALHVHLGLLVFFGAAVVLRTERRWFQALGLLLLVCLANEALDLVVDYRHGYQLRWLNGLKDIVNTAVWPTIWVAAAPRLISPPAYQARLSSRVGAQGVGK